MPVAVLQHPVSLLLLPLLLPLTLHRTPEEFAAGRPVGSVNIPFLYKTAEGACGVWAFTARPTVPLWTRCSMTYTRSWAAALPVVKPRHVTIGAGQRLLDNKLAASHSMLQVLTAQHLLLPGILPA